MLRGLIQPALPLLLCAIFNIAGAQIFPVRENGKWGYMDQSGDIVIPAVYEKAAPTVNGIARATLNGDLYLISDKDHILQIKNCTRFQMLTADVGKAMRNGEWWLTDSRGNTLSSSGYSRMWLNSLDSQRIFVTRNGKFGVLSAGGEVSIDAVHARLRCLTPGVYYTLNQFHHYTIITESDHPLNGMTFNHIHLIGDENGLILSEDEVQTKYLFKADGTKILKGQRLDVKSLGNQFFSISSYKTRRIYDNLRNVFIDTLTGVAENSEIPDCINIIRDGITRTFHRQNGYILEGNFTFSEIPTKSERPFIIRNEFYFGLLDQNYRLLLPPVYQKIEYLDENRYAVQDSNFFMGIYNFKTDSWEHKMPYLHLYRGNGYIKGYASGNLMDYFVLDSNGNITEINTYMNVYHTAVNQRYIESPESGSGSGNFLSTNRATGWYSIQQPVGSGISLWMYGLRKFDSVARVWKILIRPVFMQVKVLKTPGLSIASYSNTSRQTAIPIAGEKYPAIPLLSSYLIHEETGRKLTGIQEFIDETECDNKETPNFRTFHLGKMYILSKSTLKPVLVCLYASGFENGVRRVYTGGRFKLDDGKSHMSFPISDSRVFTALGIDQWGFSRDDVVADGGEWRLLFLDGRYVKPEIAGSNKIKNMGAFINGKAIVQLDNGKCGVIDSAGNTFIEANYDYITTESFLPDYYFCGHHSFKYGLVNQYGEIVVPPAYKTIKSMGSVYYGYTGDSGILFNPEGERAPLGVKEKPIPFENGYGFIRQKKGYLLAGNNGLERTEKLYKNATSFHNGYAAVKSGSFWGLIDTDGNWIIDPKYTGAKGFGYTSAVFEQGRNWKFVGLNDEKIQRPKKADAVAEIAPEIFVYSKGDRMALYGAGGKKLSPFRFLELPFVYNGNIIGTRGSRIYFYTLNGEKMGTMSGQLRGKNKQILKETSLGIHSRTDDYYIGFSAGQLRAFGADSPWTDLKIPLGLQYNQNLQKTFLYEAVTQDIFLTGPIGRQRFVNGNNEKLTGYTFFRAEPMQNGLSICAIAPLQWGVLDRDGFWVVPPEYADIKRLDSHMFSFRTAFDFHIYNPEGNRIMEETADSYRFADGLLQLRNGNRLGYFKPSTGIIRKLQE